MNDIEQKVINTIAETLKMGEEEISLESKLADDLGADSLDAVEIMMAIEAKFDTEISDEDASKMATTKDIVEHIKKNLNQ
ncbi:MAG: acyl carrier protein [Rickettsiales bacterium]|nr:MAG: acyl carrier protein [Rickettsiales bacterium]